MKNQNLQNAIIAELHKQNREAIEYTEAEYNSDAVIYEDETLAQMLKSENDKINDYDGYVESRMLGYVSDEENQCDEVGAIIKDVMIDLLGVDAYDDYSELSHLEQLDYMDNLGLDMGMINDASHEVN